MEDRKITLKMISKERFKKFQMLVDALVEEGYDISLRDGQTVVEIFLEESTWALSLKANGTWELV